jgi:Rod binding domain-containing protein
MEINPIQYTVKTADIPLERLAANPRLSEADKVAEVCRQFEAVMLRQILQSAHKPAFPSPFHPDSVANSIYRDMITSQLADKISKAGTFGLARTFERQLSQQTAPVNALVNPPSPASTGTISPIP